MNNTDKATARPWKVIQTKCGQHDGEGDLVEIIGCDNEIVADNQEFYPEAITEANAELIVKAVNSHDALVEALELASGYVGKAVKERYPGAGIDYMKINEALNLAKGGE